MLSDSYAAAADSYGNAGNPAAASARASAARSTDAAYADPAGTVRITKSYSYVYCRAGSRTSGSSSGRYDAPARWAAGTSKVATLRESSLTLRRRSYPQDLEVARQIAPVNNEDDEGD